jgi:cellulose 1,4-beta-cellobiosidase
LLYRGFEFALIAMSRSTHVLALLAASATAQQAGTNTSEIHPQLPSQQCTKLGGCRNVSTSIVLDSSYRWLHNVNGTNQCNPNGAFDPTYCSDPASCGKNCALEGVDYATYGIAASGSSVKLNLFTNNGSNMASPRIYLLQNATNYAMFQLLNREFTYDVDVSQLPCGVNGALYFSEMDPTGNQNADIAAGAKYGTGYCDAQCPKAAFVAGEVSHFQI